MIGAVGAAAFAAAWAPQCWQSWRSGRCDAHGGFLSLSALGSFSLAAHAYLRGDAVFLAVNVLTTAGALLNLWVKARSGRFVA